jgi:hypothetical protein
VKRQRKTVCNSRFWSSRQLLGLHKAGRCRDNAGTTADL